MAGTSFAVVRPRVLSPQTGEALLLEDVVAGHLSAGDHGVLQLLGGPVTGKTTAIEYLDRVFAEERGLSLVDAQAQLRARPVPLSGVTVTTASSEYVLSASLGRYHLARWGQDEWIEYLLAAHKSQCGSVLNRISTPDVSVLQGNPCLWRLVLDELAADDSIPSATHALRRVVKQRYSTSEVHHALRNFALVAAAPLGDELDKETRALAKLPIERPLLRLLGLEAIRIILAADALTFHLTAGGNPLNLRRRLPYALVREAALAVSADEALQQKLRDVLAETDKSLHPMAASLLHAAKIGWQPARQGTVPLPNLNNAYLFEADWPGIDFFGARLSGAKLPEANLENADLQEAEFDFADLSGIRLHGASLARARGCRAELAGADLSFVRAANAILSHSNLSEANFEGALLADVSLTGSNLSGARFVRANLSRAQLMRTDIADADFTQANLEGSSLNALDLRQACFDFAIFKLAKLRECNLEGMELSGADFEAADLRGALLTASTLTNANLRGADLRGAGLADVEWEGVDLRDADLREASFHLGSTRSGLVDSPYPSHGTRTGFYTDDYNEQDFKSPEEIRKANLCGADLRGANIEGVDFYLVDVRGAHYDREQEAHLRQCGAILKARTT
jgi:uncharacterized protein YjbI with pentapeptide repeats